jgi:hypothetical protein
MTVVRRAFAVALLGVFSFSLIPLQAFASDDEAGLPACCRRNGKHHCAMPTGEGSSSAPALQSTRCLFFPDASPGRLLPRAGALVDPAADSVTLPIRLAASWAIQTLCPILFRSPLLERGPPTSVLS